PLTPNHPHRDRHAFPTRRSSDLRVNPSSGNLHPTEAYVIAGPLDVEPFEQTSGVWHYAPDRHVIERRSAFDGDAWDLAGDNIATDRKSTRLNSSHHIISYAVFCL